MRANGCTSGRLRERGSPKCIGRFRSPRGFCERGRRRGLRNRRGRGIRRGRRRAPKTAAASALSSTPISFAKSFLRTPSAAVVSLAMRFAPHMTRALSFRCPVPTVFVSRSRSLPELQGGLDPSKRNFD